jgi:hypothetical protein
LQILRREYLAEDFSWNDFSEILEPFKDTDPVHSAPTLNGWQTVYMSKDTAGIKLCDTFSLWRDLAAGCSDGVSLFMM